MAKRPKLTKRVVDTLSTDKPGGERTYCGALAGFGVHVLPSGRKSFFQEYTVPGGGRRCRMKLGAYGDLTVAEAIDERKRVLGLLREGVDPLEERKLERSAGDFAGWAEGPRQGCRTLGGADLRGGGAPLEAGRCRWSWSMSWPRCRVRTCSR